MPNTSIPILAEELISKFNITNPSFIAEGGQKKVFRVIRDGRSCILKTFNNFSIRDLRELDIYDKYNGLNGIPKILDIQKYGEESIVFEEEIEGHSLEEIKVEYRDNAEAVIELLFRIADILDPLWCDGVVHRDLKPSNIIVQEGNKPFVIDFGIAKNPYESPITSVSFQPHTWSFAAPEQIFAQKDNISYRTDFFSLGLIAYNLYFQKLPFGDNSEEVEKYFAKKKIELTIDASCKLKNVIEELLKFSPSDRPGKITKLKEILKI